VTVTAPGPQEATGPTGADVTYDVSATDPETGDFEVTCNPPGETGTGTFSVTAHFGLGSTTVTCTAADGTTGSAVVQVQDTTAPSLDQPPDINETTPDPTKIINYALPNATDLVDGPVTPVCTPPSGSSFDASLGGTTTDVKCTATDAHSNTSEVHFNVTVTRIDTIPPTFDSPPSDIGPREAEGPGGANVSFPTPTASDNIGVPVVVCSPASGSLFGLGTTTVTCTATDGAGNTAQVHFNVTVNDTTAPLINQPANVIAEATGPTGAAVVYPAVTASDIVDGTISATCSPGSGSVFAMGDSTVTCNATDAHNNHATPKTFNVTVRDTTGPVVTGAPAQIRVEANGPTGSFVNFPPITATDLVDGPIAAVPCAPASGTKFPLGTTNVKCTATDSHGNKGSASFPVTVADTTPPTLVVPVARSVYATTATGIPSNVGAVSGFLSDASATDLVDPSPAVLNNAPSFIPIGVQAIIFTARDSSGNATSKEVSLVVLPQPPAGTPPLPVPPAPRPPAEVRNLAATPGDGSVRLSWQKPSGIDHVVVRRSLSGEREGQIVYTGSAVNFVDRGLVNGTEYRYVVTTVDTAGNSSAGIAAVAVPRRNLLRSPKDGARLRKPPKLVWAADGEADYYNAQLLRNGVKILSVWPTKAAFTLHKSWKFQGRKYTLTRGMYRWYVWPGFGARSLVDYGELLGSRSFQIIR
jgi:HYR domain-containing protein